MSDVIEKISAAGGGPHSVCFRCPGCAQAGEGAEYHNIRVEGWTDGNGHCWSWNGSMERPTFTPSILVQATYGEDNHPVVCHSFVTDGQILFLDDCTHPLKGQRVLLPPVGEDLR